MVIAFSLVAMLVALALIWRGYDVRAVLLGTALLIGGVAGEFGVVFRKTVDTLGDTKFLLPICSAMGFAYAVRDAGCVEALVRVLIKPILRVPQLVVPGCAAAALIVNSAIPSQTSTIAAVGSLMVALMARLGTARALAGAALIFGASIAGAIFNPGLADVGAVAKLTNEPATVVSVNFAPGILIAFAIGIVVLMLTRRLGLGTDDAPLVAPTEDAAVAPPPAYKALFPPLPIIWLLLAHPLLPWAGLLAPVLMPGYDVVIAMLAGTVLTIALASPDRARATRAFFEGMGYAFANVITIIAVSAGTAKALEVAGVLNAFVDLASGSPVTTLMAAFILAFLLSVISGSGTASSVALCATIGVHAEELGVDRMALGGVILFGAEAGRTTSPVSAVLLFGSALVDVPPRTMMVRLMLPCLLAAIGGAVFVAFVFQ